MNKTLSIILISFFSVLTYKYNMGFTIYIPIIIFLVKANEKNIFIIFPLSIISIYFIVQEAVASLLLLDIFIVLYILFIKKKNNKILDFIYAFFINLMILLFQNKTLELNSLMIYLCFSVVAGILLSYFQYNIEGVLSKQNTFRNYGFVEVVMGISVIIGSTTISIENINIGLFVAMFYAMYLSSNSYYLHSLFLSIISTFVLKIMFNVNESIMLPFISGLYILPGIYGSSALISFCLLGWLSNISYFSVLSLQVTILLVIFFEIFKSLIVSNQTSKNEFLNNAYQNNINNINNEIINFASFLDLFARDFSISKEYSQKISEGINVLISNHCENCYVRNECFQRNNKKLYTYFKNLILYSKRSDFTEDNSDTMEFFRKCPYIVEMRRTSALVNERLNLSNTSSRTNTLIAQINGVSNVLRQYSIDNSLKTEINPETFLKIKKAISDYGYNVCYFNPKKLIVDDFYIELGIRGETFTNIKKVIERISNNYIENKVTVNYIKVEKGKTYVSIIPRINFDIDYGSGSLAEEPNTICGDNYLIKQLENSNLVAAISDGMGKGYLANQESNTTLRLVDEITNVDITTSTALQILNTFYFIQDYLEKYSTLDFVEIKRTTGECLFYKMGASTTYLFHKNGSFEKIENENLPFGIEEIIETKTLKLQNGDIIIMGSDGVFENIEKEKELETYILGIMHLPVQKITYELLNYTRNNKRKTNDDMSIITLKIQNASL